MAKWDLDKQLEHPKMPKLHEYDDYDAVEQPKHYNQSGIECIVAIEAMTESMSPRVAPHAANVLKYLWRHEYKNGVEDLDKAMWYLRRLRGRYVGEEG
jgi:hypothetical protein